ncbi:MAG: hypothetical protein AB7T10_00795 [bacterium]
MKIFTAIILAALSFLTLFPQEFIFRDDPLYDEIEFLVRRDIIDIDFLNLPMRSDKVILAIESAWIEKMNKENGFSQEELIAINSILERYSRRDDLVIEDDASFLVSYSDSVDYLFKNILYAKKNIPHGILVFEILTEAPFENTDSTSFRMDEWKNTGSDCRNTYAAVFGDAWSILFGRILPAWGQGIKDDIFFSRKILPMDGLLAEIYWESGSFSFFAANKSEYHHANKRTVDNAYMSSHKLSFKLPFKTTLSFKETVLYRSNLPQMYYLNPAMFYYVIQHNSHSDDNIFWSLEISNKRIEGLLLSGEFFIDDFQYDKDYEYVPHKIGLLLNGSLSLNIRMNPIFYGEYCFINTYTNTHQYTSLSYSYYNAPMSYMSGTDMDNISFGVKTIQAKNLEVYLDISYLRQGDGKLTNSWESEMPDSDLAFPSGTIDRIISSEIGMGYKFNKILSFEISALASLLNGYEESGEEISNRGVLNLTGKLKVVI